MNADKVSSAVCAGVLVFAGLTGGALRAETPAYSAASYVQDGLVGLWDGVENAGWNTHDATSTVWVDLTGKTGDLTVNERGQFEATGLKKIAGGGVMAFRDAEVWGVRQIEVVISGIDVTRDDWAFAVWLTNRQYVAVSDYKATKPGCRRMICDYYSSVAGLETSGRPAVSSYSVTFNAERSAATARWHGGFTDVRTNGGVENNGGTFAVGASSTGYYGKNMTGFTVHSIRFYDRELTVDERRANLIVDNLRFGAAVYSIPGEIVWTGGAGDGKFSSAANWDVGMPIFPGSRYEKIRLTAQGAETIENDVGVLTTQCLRVEQAADPSLSVTLRGEPFVLTSSRTPYHTTSDDEYPLVADCPLTIDADVTFAGERGVSRAKKSIVYERPVVILTKNEFYISAVNGATHTFNGSVTAPDATFETKSGQHDYFNGPVIAKLLKPGGSSSLEYFHFASAGNGWSSRPNLYGGFFADAENALPTNLVFRWQPDVGTDNTDAASHFYTLRYDQTCDRIESAAVIGKAAFKGVIRERNRIRSDTRDITLTLRGTDNATHYGHLESQGSRKLNLVWDPTGDFTQAIGDIRQSMIGELVVKGGTLASIGTNSFPRVTALRIGDGAAFAVRASEYNGATNPFPGTTELRIGGSGRIEVAAGVTATFSLGVVRGAWQPVGTYQSKDGTDGTATKVDWVTGDGLVSISTCDGTSWKDASVSGDWNDPANWSNGLPDPSRPVYLTAEGGNYEVAMKTGDAWPLNLVIRGANATLTVGEGQTVGFDGASKTASVSVEDGATLTVAGTLGLENYAGTFTVGSASAATSRVAVVTGGRFLYAPQTGKNYPLVLNPNGALDVSGGTVTMPGKDWNMLKMAGGLLLASGNGVFCYSGFEDGSKYSLDVALQSGEALFSGNSVFTNFPGAAQQITFAPATAGESLHVAFRRSARFAFATDGFRIGNSNTYTAVEFGSEVEHARLGNRVRVCAKGEGDAEMRVSSGKVWNDGRGLDIADDDKADVVTHGRLVQTGGWIYNNASNGAWSDQGKQNGFTVGYGANAPGTAGCVAFGEAFLSGGTNQNVKGVTLVGTGYGEGTVVQTGGFNWHDSTTEAFGIGVAGGLGRWTVSNGTLRVKADAYIGGFSSNILTKAEKMTRWPDTRHDAEGTLTVAGGAVEFQKNLVLGADGVGTVERIGTVGTFTVGGDLVLSNTTANAQSGGTLRFVCTADGVRPIEVAGTARFCAGAKMSVDVRGWTNVSRRQWLVRANAFENPIPEDDVEVTGRSEATREAVVARMPTGYCLRVPRGMIFVVR